MLSINDKRKNKKIIFDDDGDIVPENVIEKKNLKKSKDFINTTSNAYVTTTATEENNINGIYDNKRKNEPKNYEDELGKKWYEIYAEFNNTGELVELKDTEEKDLQDLCKNAFDNDLPHLLKRNPSDVKWLETALHSGTSKDKSNAGALLITTNPLGNLSTLETLIGFTKLSNKSSPEAITIVTELFMDKLLPSNRKLINFSLRGADWKKLRKNEELTKELRNKIYAYWYFENQLKEHYFEFLKNVQHSIQTGQDNNKNCAIISVAKLLSYGPEKEQMLLSMIINKLGDPSSKVASKALHHLSEVAYKHPNMAGVITIETEKLLFRNNISERAQHFALCFLAQIAPHGNSDVCTKLVNICFSLFNVLVKRGAVNSKTMQAILRCLQKAIIEAKPSNGNTEIMTKEMQDTIYRLVHLADIQITIQTFSLLLQLITIKSEKADRFYNALYRKLLDLNLTIIGNKTAAQFLHIVHRAIHIDQNLSRAQAFLKRLLQLALYLPSQIACGCLVVASKLLKTRKELCGKSNEDEKQSAIVMATEEELAKFDSDGEEKYEDVNSENENDAEKKIKPNSGISSSWHHAKIINKSENIDGEENFNYDNEKKISNIASTKYDPYHRVAAYAGGEFSIRTELLLLKEHYHPTVKVFAENIIDRKKIDYYGDPLKDFNLTHFLERFAFKNPKKVNEKDVDAERTATQQIHHKKYMSYGSRGLSVKSLTKANCTEDERFIFNYLEQKRSVPVIKKSDKEEDDGEDVDDDEFDAYLDGLCRKSKGNIEDDEEFEMDYMKELGADLKDNTNKNNKKKKKSKYEDSDDGEDIDNDWDDDDADDISADSDNEEQLHDMDDNEFGGSDDEGSISLDENDADGDDIDSSSTMSEAEEDIDDEPKSKKVKKMDGKSFSRALKDKTDMSSLFAAADDFAELLEETGKQKGHGTSNAVFNRDKSSDKQLKWEEKRRSVGNYKVNKKFNKKKNKFGKKL